MDSRRISAVAAAVTLLSMAGRWAPGWLLESQIARWTTASGSGPFPLLGSVGQTVTTYLYAVRATELLLSLALGVGLGVWLARRVEANERRSGLRAIAVGSSAVVALPVLAAIVVWNGFDLAGIAMGLAMGLNLVVAGPVFVTVAAAAGVTLETLGVFDGGESDQESDIAADDASATPDPGQPP